MIIECMTCPVRGTRCDDCMVTALLMPEAPDLPLDGAERAAVGRLVAAGLVTPETAGEVRARREPWQRRRAVG